MLTDQVVALLALLLSLDLAADREYTLLDIDLEVLRPQTRKLSLNQQLIAFFVYVQRRAAPALALAATGHDERVLEHAVHHLAQAHGPAERIVSIKHTDLLNTTPPIRHGLGQRGTLDQPHP